MDPGAYHGSISFPLGNMMPGYAVSPLRLGGEWLYSICHVSFGAELMCQSGPRVRSFSPLLSATVSASALYEKTCAAPRLLAWAPCLFVFSSCLGYSPPPSPAWIVGDACCLTVGAVAMDAPPAWWCFGSTWFGSSGLAFGSDSSVWTYGPIDLFEGVRP